MSFPDEKLAGQIGYYGKAIQRGDFVSHNLPRVFINVLDDWLQQMLQHGSRKHGGNWPSLYAKAPVYRFICSKNLAGETPWFGVVSPSSDKVGRQFPFCLAGALPANFLPIHQYQSLEPLFQTFEGIVKELHSKSYSFDSLAEKLAQLREAEFNQRRYGLDTALQSQASSSNALNLRTNCIIPDSQAVLTSILDVVLEDSAFNYSLWLRSAASTADEIHSVNSDTKSLLCSGLPAQAEALALFDNDWSSTASALIDAKQLTTDVDSPVKSEHTIVSGLAAMGAESLQPEGNINVPEMQYQEGTPTLSKPKGASIKTKEFADTSDTSNTLDKRTTDLLTSPDVEQLHNPMEPESLEGPSLEEGQNENDVEPMSELPLDKSAYPGTVLDCLISTESDQGEDWDTVEATLKSDKATANPKVELLEIEDDETSIDPWES